MDNILFLNRGSVDARIKLISEDGNPIDTNSNGAIFKDGNNLGFCIKSPGPEPELIFADDSGVIKLHGQFAIGFEGTDIYDRNSGFNPSHIVNASDFQQFLEIEFPEYFQVEVPETEPAGGSEAGIPYSYILKTKFRRLTLKIYRLDMNSTISSVAVDQGSSATWIDPDTSNGVTICIGNNAPLPAPLTF